MTDDPQYPSQPTPPGGYAVQRPARGPRPAPVALAVKLIWLGIAVSVVSAVITLVMLNTLVDDALQQTGAQDVPEDTIRATVIGATIVGVLIGVGLNALFAIFIGKGANWARITYSVLAALGLVFSLLGLLGGNVAGPVVLTMLSFVGLAITVVVLVLLWKRESNAWFKTPRFVA